MSWVYARNMYVVLLCPLQARLFNCRSRSDPTPNTTTKYLYTAPSILSQKAIISRLQYKHLAQNFTDLCLTHTKPCRARAVVVVLDKEDVYFVQMR